jgi:type III secretory pathway component EscV
MTVVWAMSASAAESTNKVAKQDVPAVTAGATNDLDALTLQEEALDLQAREVTQKLISLTRPLWIARQNAMAEDGELRALTAEIDAKRMAIEKKLAEKYPDLAAKMKEQESLMRQHADLSMQLKDVRKKLDGLTATPAKVETK